MAALGGVVNNRGEVVTTRTGHKPAVIVFSEEHQSFRGATYLLRPPVDAQRLVSVMKQLDRNGGIPYDLLGGY